MIIFTFTIKATGIGVWHVHLLEVMNQVHALGIGREQVRL